MNKALAVALVLCAGLAVAQPAAAQPDMDQYNRSCAVCHTTGAANAPKTHDVEAWKPRMEKGMDALVQTVTSGLNAMPPKGMCFDCTPEDYKALIEYMSSPAE